MRKKILVVLVMLFMLLLIGRFIYRSIHIYKDHIEAPDAELYHAMMMNSVAPEVESAGEFDSTTYNAKKIIHLIDVAKKIKGDVSSSFGLVSRKKKVDCEEVRYVLNELIVERTNLRSYIWDLKGHSARTNIPVKKYRAFMYYLEILDNNIAEMRTILQRYEPTSYKEK